MHVQNRSAIEAASLPDRFVDRRAAAAFLGLSVSTLATWASDGHGPTFTKLSAGRSGCVRYRLSELEKFARDPVTYRPRPVEKFRRPQSLKQPNVSLARARRKRHGKAKA
jgi:hypothetical protein